MVIIDTSVWIEYFKCNEPYFKEVQGLIDSRSVFAIEAIFGELLQGALSKREKDYILRFWNYISKIEEPELFIKAGELSFDKKLISKGIKLIDASIIFCTINYNFKLWTLDKKIIQFLDQKSLYNHGIDE
jgi:predicted nucleic acid-binding protein